MNKHWILSGLLAAGLLAGCGSSSNNSGFSGATTTQPGSAPTGGSFLVAEDGPIERDGHVVDAVELEAYDAQGKRLGQEVVPFEELMTFAPLPSGTTSVQLDYLRHGGVPIFRATVPVQANQDVLDNPQEQPITAKTDWKIEPQSDGGFKLKLTSTEGTKVKTVDNFRIKGICYGPCPINVQGDGAPQINDFFYDPILEKGVQVFANWYALWGFGSLGTASSLATISSRSGISGPTPSASTAWALASRTAALATRMPRSSPIRRPSRSSRTSSSWPAAGMPVRTPSS